jgi:hypothetical protein
VLATLRYLPEGGTLEGGSSGRGRRERAMSELASDSASTVSANADSERQRGGRMSGYPAPDASRYSPEERLPSGSQHRGIGGHLRALAHAGAFLGLLLVGVALLALTAGPWLSSSSLSCTFSVTCTAS